MSLPAGLVFLLVPCCLAADAQTDRILARLAEEAAAFLRVAPFALSEETLVQKTSTAPSLLRPGGGAARRTKAGDGSGTRVIVSEYGFSTFADSPNALHEIRQVISVDGRQVRNRESARLSLSLGSRSQDDRVKRRMLRELENYGLKSAVLDLGQLLLLFAPSRLNDYVFELKERSLTPPAAVLIYNFRQVRGEEAVTIFEGRTAQRQPIQGELWAREQDGLPLRVAIRTERVQGGHRSRHEATVDYAVSPYGVLLPSAVVHREYLDDRLEVENLFSYAPFRKFGAETQIKFDEAPAEEIPR